MGSKLNVFVVGAGKSLSLQLEKPRSDEFPSQTIGVVGLSTAIRALEAGFDVTIFAEAFPEDDKSIKYTSCWAAANHVSVATTNALLHRQPLFRSSIISCLLNASKELERETFSVFSELLKEDPPCSNYDSASHSQRTHPSRIKSIALFGA